MCFAQLLVLSSTTRGGESLTSCGEDGAVNATEMTTVCQVEGADDVAADGGFLVVLAPIDVRPACDAGTVEDVGWPDAVELCHDRFTIFHASGRLGDWFLLLFEHFVQVTGDPAIAAPDQKRLLASLSRLK